MAAELNLGGIPVDVVLKNIKNVHLTVHPPTGTVRISAPSRMSLATIRLFAISKLPWIRQQQTKLRAQEREPPREFLNRESHYVWGRRYLLTVIESEEPSIELTHRRLRLRVRPGTDRHRMQASLDRWYRDRIREAVPPLIAKWTPIVGVEVEGFFVQRMKTRWGSCNAAVGTIRLNTDLAKKPPECLEYIVVHEMVHLAEPNHGAGFVRTMDRVMPQWRHRREQLNRLPLRHDDWIY